MRLHSHPITSASTRSPSPPKGLMLATRMIDSLHPPVRLHGARAPPPHKTKSVAQRSLSYSTLHFLPPDSIGTRSVTGHVLGTARAITSSTGSARQWRRSDQVRTHLMALRGAGTRRTWMHGRPRCTQVNCRPVAWMRRLASTTQQQRDWCSRCACRTAFSVMK